MEPLLRDRWNRNAEAYAELIAGTGTPYHQSILLPAIERLVGEVMGIRILDAGCGEGYLSRLFARRGAIVTGVDVSEKLVEISRVVAQQENVSVSFSVGDVCDLRDFADSSFDVVLSNLVLLNIPCLQRALAEFYRVLRPGGIVVFSIVHPAFNFYGPGRWELGERNHKTGRRVGKCFIVDKYFDERPYERFWKRRGGERFPEPITFYHRTITPYFAASREAGFQVDTIEEPQPMNDDPFFERERRIPMFMVFRLRKPET
ncbi:MAG: hypothetical protein DRO87_08080 [Candidatus Thorarchaeota archaeon]|nr:MAG: hypothetical protein DRO87_08080 [Candidatus Thorarchaeota archaeon]